MNGEDCRSPSLARNLVSWLLFTQSLEQLTIYALFFYKKLSFWVSSQFLTDLSQIYYKSFLRVFYYSNIISEFLPYCILKNVTENKLFMIFAYLFVL